jgi:5'-3' exonuclease
MKYYIIIDASYFILYRYHALKKWWGFSNKDIPLGELPHENEEFMEKYITTFRDKLLEIINKLKIKNKKDKHIEIKYIIAKDCPRSSIWRNDIYESYKGNREKSETSISFIFKHVFDNNLFLLNDKIEDKTITSMQIVDYDRLEADDCVSLCVKYIKNKYTSDNVAPEYNIAIIASDIDYLQLASENINIYNLKYNKINDNNYELNLFIKIVIGDKSDNISGIFKKCGPKTAAKYFENMDEFYKKVNETENCKKLYERNKTLIDFNYIPEIFSNEFYNKYDSFLSTL